jgi:hypothetical protein
MLKSIFEKQRNVNIWNVGKAFGVACELMGNQLIDDAYFGIYDMPINYLGFNENWIFYNFISRAENIHLNASSNGKGALIRDLFSVVFVF